jgi:LCP family protein required for cell wall assembly
VSADHPGGNGEGEERQRPDETDEFEISDEPLEKPADEQHGPDEDDLADADEPEGDLDDADLEEEGLEEEDLDEEDLDEEELDEEEPEDKGEDELLEEDELERVVSAETQEWDGLEAAEAEGAEEKTLVASAGTRIKRTGSAITSGFEKVEKGAGSKITSGFKAVRRHIGFPLWLRFITASFVIIASIAAATSASLILYLGDIAHALKDNSIGQGVKNELADIPDSGAQTILILGSDKRNKELSGKYGLSDTTMLLRLDPNSHAIALLSLPRDLKVEIPGYGIDKLNAAYALGGPKLTLQTVKQLLGPQVAINHLVNVDFTGFARAVNAIGCVYVDVDHRYFHQNGPYSSSSDYAEINLQPGYQALCGFDALSFARYRHTDNDIVRAARQQAFLREARAKVPPSRLIDDRKKLIKIFTSYTSSDIDEAVQMLQVLKLFFDLRNAQIKEIHFTGTLGPSYVTATPREVHTAVDQFLGSESTPGPAGSTAKPSEKVAPEQPPDYSKVTPAAPKRKSRGGSSVSTNLTETTYGKQLGRAIRARKLKVPIYYPTQLEVGSDYAQKPRAYKINGKGDESPPHSERAAYKWVFSLPTLGDYYGFEGTRWKDPPILDNPTDEKTIGNRDYKLYYDGDRLRMVAWQTDHGSFWLSNSFIETVSNADMLKIAQSFRQLPRT